MKAKLVCKIKNNINMRKCVFFIIYILSFLGVSNAQTIELNHILKEMPNEVIFGLEPTTIQYLLENPNDSIRRTSTNIYSDITREKISKDYISIKTSDMGRTEIRLLPLINDSEIICVVKTVCASICDSRIYFYTDKWIPISADDLVVPMEVNWFLKNDVDKDSDAYKIAVTSLQNLLPIVYQLSADSLTLTLTVDPKTYLDSDTYKEIKPILNPYPKTLVWNKKIFK